MRCVELGGGPVPTHPEYEQFDMTDWGNRTGLVYTLGDARSLPYEDDSLDRVFASNLLEHFPWRESLLVLREWTRVLRPGGQLELVTPDLLGIVADYKSGVNDWTVCCERVGGSQDYEGNVHLAFFTLEEFPALLEAAGGLRVLSCNSSHNGGGIHCVAEKGAV